MHGAHTAWKTTVSVAWVGTRGKVSPAVVGVFVGLLSCMGGWRGRSRQSRQIRQQLRLLSSVVTVSETDTET